MRNLERRLIDEQEIVTKGWLTDAICKMKIYRVGDEDGFDIVLSKPDRENYVGKSTSNNFEYFATVIKNEHLMAVDPDHIRWFNFLEWNREGYEDFETKIFMTWTGKKYIDPIFAGRAS